MDATPCSCLGENPRCFRCFDTGVYAKETPTPNKKGVLGVNKPNARLNRRALKKSQANSAVKNKSAELSKTTKSKTFKHDEFVCNFCGIVALTALVLKAHQQAVHSSPHSKKPRPSQHELKESNLLQGSKPNGVLPDATGGWSGAFRDRAEFGSPVAYDSMDDESTS